MLDREIELQLLDQMILPTLKLSGPGESCLFLNEAGRCSIHPLRPGICRLYPLGRYYHDGTFSYILQTGECRAKNRYKVRVRQWIDIPDPEPYDRFVNDWHRFIRETPSSQTRRDAMLYILRLFFTKAYEPEQDFYTQFYDRLQKASVYL